MFAHGKIIDIGKRCINELNAKLDNVLSHHS